MKRIRQLPSGGGKAFLWKQWQWVLQPEENSCSIKEEMARMGFIQGRPLKEYLMRDGEEICIGKKERPDLLECIQDLWITVDTYLYHLWKLRGSISSAPKDVQRTLRTQTVTPKDLSELIRNPYYARSQRGKTQHWMSSLAKFCKHRRHLQPVAAESAPVAPIVAEGTTSRWDPEWTRWLTRQSAFGKSSDKSTSAKRKPPKKRKKSGPGNHTSDPL